MGVVGLAKGLGTLASDTRPLYFERTIMAEPIKGVGELAGLCGHDGSNWEKVLIDASKRLVVAVASVVAQEADMYGYISGAWQKQPLLFGYGGVVADTDSNTDCAAGLNTLTTTAVPSGEIHTINTVAGVNFTSITTSLLIDVNHDGAYYYIYRGVNVASGVVALVNGPIVLDAGDFIRARFYGCTLHDSIKLDILGFKTDLDL